MGRPVDIDKRQALIAEAVEVLRKEGLDLPMATLADRLGMKRPTLIYYFPSKAEIVEAALEAMLTEQAVFVLGKMMEHEHPLDQLYAQVRAVHEFHHGREDRLLFLTQAIAATGLDRSNQLIEIGNAAFEAHRQAMRARLEDAIADGRMHTCDIGALIQLIRSTIDGLMVQRFMTGCDLKPVHQFLWDHVLGPLKKTPEEP